MVRMAATSGHGRARSAHDLGGDHSPGVYCSPGFVRLVDPALFDDLESDLCRHFLRLVFRIEEVRSVAIDPVRASALIEYARDRVGEDELLDRLADALRDHADLDPAADAVPIPRHVGAATTLKISRYGSILSTWEVVHELPGRLRLQNQAISADLPTAQRIARELDTVHGVESCRVSPATASFLVRHDPGEIATRQILQILDHLVAGSDLALAPTHDPASARFGLANAAVGLAVVSEFAVPALLPASALLLVASNTKTFRTAWHELRHRQPGLPLLTTTIITVTLASGQFIAAALMGWLMQFWRHQHHERQQASRLRLLPTMARHRRFARLVVGSVEVDVLLDRLKPGDRVVVGVDEFAPADGRVILGSALVDERPIQGGTGLIRKRVGDPIYAGSRVVVGEVRVEVAVVGAATRAAQLATVVLAGLTAPPAGGTPADHGAGFARNAVLPTLATAALGLLVGDLNTVAAILRPDYATGPGLGVGLEVLEDSAACAREGVIIRDSTAFRRLAAADMILFDDHPDLGRRDLVVAALEVAAEAYTADDLLRYAAGASHGLGDERAAALEVAVAARGLASLGVTDLDLRGVGITFMDGPKWITVSDAPAGEDPATEPGGSPPVASLTVAVDGRRIGSVAFRRADHLRAAAAIQSLRAFEPLVVGLLSSRPEAAIEGLAASLGIEQFRGGLTAEAKAVLLRSFQEAGVKVVFVGDARREPAAARAAHLAISLTAEVDAARDSAAIVLLPGDLIRLGGLLALARSHVDRVHTIYGSAVIPNLACIAGAFFFGFTSLAVVVVTNLGTLGVATGMHRRFRERPLVRPASPMPR